MGKTIIPGIFKNTGYEGEPYLSLVLLLFFVVYNKNKKYRERCSVNLHLKYFLILESLYAIFNFICWVVILTRQELIRKGISLFLTVYYTVTPSKRASGSFR